jgi:hypothetical protein
MLPPKRMEFATEFFVIDSSTLNGYQNPTKLYRIYPGLLYLSKKIQEFVPSKQEMCYRQVFACVEKCSFKQISPLKPAELDMKPCQLC